jgi:nucleotide-binding universal stress UspA family protein
LSKAPPKRFAKMLVATDGSAASQQACEVAAQIAEGFGSEVTILSAAPPVSAFAAPLEEKYYSDIGKRASENVESAATVFASAGVAVSGKEALQAGASVIQTIVEYAADKETDLIVMGTRGLGGFRRLALGSVSSDVAAHAPCATLVVRPGNGEEGAPASIKRVLVAIDGSQNSQSALEVAVDMAKHLKAELQIAHVAYVPGLFWSMGSPGSSIYAAKIEEDSEKVARQLLSEAVRFAEAQGIEDPKEEMLTEMTSPAQGIVQLAERRSVDVIVIGTRGNGGFKKMLLGSVANSVLHYAHCSVLVTR